MHEKLTKCPNFTWYVPAKLTKCRNFTWYLPEKSTKFPNFTRFLAEKNSFCPNLGATPYLCLPRLLRLCPCYLWPDVPVRPSPFNLCYYSPNTWYAVASCLIIRESFWSLQYSVNLPVLETVTDYVHHTIDTLSQRSLCSGLLQFGVGLAQWPHLCSYTVSTVSCTAPRTRIQAQGILQLVS